MVATTLQMQGLLAASEDNWARQRQEQMEDFARVQDELARLREETEVERQAVGRCASGISAGPGCVCGHAGSGGPVGSRG